MVQNIWLEPNIISPRRSNQKLAKPTTRYDQSRYPGVKKQNDGDDTNYLIGTNQAEPINIQSEVSKRPIRDYQSRYPGVAVTGLETKITATTNHTTVQYFIWTPMKRRKISFALGATKPLNFGDVFLPFELQRSNQRWQWRDAKSIIFVLKVS